MISLLASPSVCVIDEDPKDFGPILNALNALYVSCVHIKGDDASLLPTEPFKGLRLVFTDLHLTNTSGKNTASHTANVFQKVVSAETAPVIVVIWSKYAKDHLADSGLPPEDQETEAELFKRTLLENEKNYKDRLIFIEMAKPKPSDRPEDWVGELKKQIEQTLQGQEAIHALWAWESLVKEAGQSVSEGLTSLVRSCGMAVGEGLMQAMQLIVEAQSEGEVSIETSPKQLATVLSQLLMDQIEHPNGVTTLSRHAKWLSEKATGPVTLTTFAPQMNGLLLTAATQNNPTPFLPGEVYRVTKHEKFKELFGAECFEFITELYKKDKSVTLQEWLKIAEPVLVEISSACEIDQGDRLNALLMAGLILPVNARSNAKASGAFEVLPNFTLRWPMDEFEAQDSFLIFCSRYKVTTLSTVVPVELKPWFRLRELPTASLRNWHAGHASRVGYVSL